MIGVDNHYLCHTIPGNNTASLQQNAWHMILACLMIAYGMPTVVRAKAVEGGLSLFSGQWA